VFRLSVIDSAKDRISQVHCKIRRIRSPSTKKKYRIGEKGFTPAMSTGGQNRQASNDEKSTSEIERKAYQEGFIVHL
jgi:hypothetical protein